MNITLYKQTLRHILRCLVSDKNFIECGFNFQISGTDEGEEFMINESADFVKNDFGDVSVSYNGKMYDLNYWLDCNDYNNAKVDAITITHVNFY
jgi:hypothetical protein